MNTFGRNLRVTTFGESHGAAMGGVIDGFPPGFKIDFDKLNKDIAERKPGSSHLVTPRKETDLPEFLSGISSDGVTLGTPIGFIVRNSDHHSNDYDEMANKYRPNHADYTYTCRFGIRDHRGGGRASARETVNWVVAGALANQWLKSLGVTVSSILSGVGKFDFSESLKNELINQPETLTELKVPLEYKDKFEKEILCARNRGDSIGGVVTGLVSGLKPGIGNPVFGKLHAALAQAMMCINAAKAFEYGAGSAAAGFLGSEAADIFYRISNGSIRTIKNFSGGIQGGISNGMPVYFKVTFKPTPTIMMPLPTLDTNGEETILKGKGRHDPCVAVRAVPVVKAMTALTIADFLL